MKKCFECGSVAEHHHHVVPRSMGGTKTVPLCTDCHAIVHGLEKSTWKSHSILTRMGLMRAYPGMKYEHAVVWLHYFILGHSLNEIEEIGISNVKDKMKLVEWLSDNDRETLKDIVKHLQDSPEFKDIPIVPIYMAFYEGKLPTFKQGSLFGDLDSSINTDREYANN